MNDSELAAMLAVAVEEATIGRSEGGVPIGAALFGPGGVLLGRGRNRRVQDGDPATHAETAAFRAAGRRAHYRDTIMATTLSPCWYCSGLIFQFGIGHVVIGDATSFAGGCEWLGGHGTRISMLDDRACTALITEFIETHPRLWAEDIGRAG